ncbi:MAG: hypothetical protein BPH100C_211 [Phage 5P_2]|nr:MAG: hypothetical protein BPH100C_211 [Phage 5P_2]
MNIKQKLGAVDEGLYRFGERLIFSRRLEKCATWFLVIAMVGWALIVAGWVIHQWRTF